MVYKRTTFGFNGRYFVPVCNEVILSISFFLCANNQQKIDLVTITMIHLQVKFFSRPISSDWMVVLYVAFRWILLYGLFLAVYKRVIAEICPSIN